MSMIGIVLFNFIKNMLQKLVTLNFHTCCKVPNRYKQLKIYFKKGDIAWGFLVFRNDAYIG